MNKNHQFFIDIANFPNKLCIFRIVVILISVTCFLCGLPLTASIVGLIAGITDKIDGIYARRHNMCTELGALLDQISDLMFNFFVMAAAAVMGIWPIWVLFLWGFRDLSVLCMRTSAGQLGFSIHSSSLGRIATFEMFCAQFFMPLDWALNNPNYMYADWVQAHFHPYVGIGMHWFALIAILVGIVMQYITAVKYVKMYVQKYDEAAKKAASSDDCCNSKELTSDEKNDSEEVKNEDNSAR